MNLFNSSRNSSNVLFPCSFLGTTFSVTNMVVFLIFATLSVFLSTVWVGKDIFLENIFILDFNNSWLVLLTNLLAPVVVLISLQSVKNNLLLYFTLLGLIFIGLNGFFMSDNLLALYIYFEVLAIPMFLLIGIYGGASRVAAAYKFFIYSVIGSATILPCLAWIFFQTGTLSYRYLADSIDFTLEQQIWLFIGFIIPFAVKIPILPLHLWLPEAHVEAPTAVSVLLAGLLLKTGGFAINRIILILFPDGAKFWAPLCILLSVISILYATLYSVAQADIKKMIAYASINHMNIVLLFCFLSISLDLSKNAHGVNYLMLTHGIISSGLFAGVGCLYDRYHTRLLRAYSSVSGFMPIFTVLFFILVLGNIAFPFTGGFIAEFALLLGILLINPFIAVFAGLTVILTIFYSFWLFNRVFFGKANKFLKKFNDLTAIELAFLGLLSYFAILSGFMSDIFFNSYIDTYSVFLGIMSLRSRMKRNKHSLLPLPVLAVAFWYHYKCYEDIVYIWIFETSTRYLNLDVIILCICLIILLREFDVKNKWVLYIPLLISIILLVADLCLYANAVNLGSPFLINNQYIYLEREVVASQYYFDFVDQEKTANWHIDDLREYGRYLEKTIFTAYVHEFDSLSEEWIKNHTFRTPPIKPR